MRKKIFLIALFCIAMVFGCSAKITFVKFAQDAESDSGSTAAADRQTPTGNKSINVLVLKADNSTLRTDTKQDANGELAAGLEGATAATDAIRDAASLYAPDFSKKDSGNTTNGTTPAAAKSAVVTDFEVEDDGGPVTESGEEVTTEIGKCEKLPMYSAKGYKGIRTKKLGPAFGKSVRITCENGNVTTIPDTSQRYEERPRIEIWRPGGIGLTKTSELFTSHGGMGFWTKKAGSSTFATICPTN